MKKITKGNAPDFWVSFVAKHPTVMYDNLNLINGGHEVRNQLRTYLTQEQGNVCCYCCSILSAKESHNEHIKPQDIYKNITMDYNNIVVSCTQKQHSANSSCGMKKDCKYDEQLFVSPLDDDCAEHFTFYPNGSIDFATPQGSYTLDLLGLNKSKSLRENRKQQYYSVYNFCVFEVLDLCQGITTTNSADYTSARELYRDFFNEQVIPQYFSQTDGQWPAYIDMLEYFKAKGRFDFDSIVSDLISSRRLLFDAD